MYIKSPICEVTRMKGLLQIHTVPKPHLLKNWHRPPRLYCVLGMRKTLSGHLLSVYCKFCYWVYLCSLCMLHLVISWEETYLVLTILTKNLPELYFWVWMRRVKRPYCTNLSNLVRLLRHFPLSGSTLRKLLINTCPWCFGTLAVAQLSGT